MLCIKVASIYCDLICADESVVTIWFKVNYTKIWYKSGFHARLSQLTAFGSEQPLARQGA